MALQIVEKNEVRELVYDKETSFFYRRITALELENLNKRYKKKGDNSTALNNAVLALCLHPWKGFVDSKGVDVPFNIKNMAGIELNVMLDLIQRIMGGEGDSGAPEDDSEELTLANPVQDDKKK